MQEYLVINNNLPSIGFPLHLTRISASEFENSKLVGSSLSTQITATPRANYCLTILLAFSCSSVALELMQDLSERKISIANLEHRSQTETMVSTDHITRSGTLGFLIYSHGNVESRQGRVTPTSGSW